MSIPTAAWEYGPFSDAGLWSICLIISYPVDIKCELIVDLISVSLITSQNEPRFMHL